MVVGFAIALVVLAGALILAVVTVASDDDSSSATRIPGGVRGEGVIRTTPVSTEHLIETATSEAEDFLTEIAEATPIVLTLSPPTATRQSADEAEQDDSAELPGKFVATQGRGHFSDGFAGHAMTPFCNGVRHSATSDPAVEIQTVGPVNRCYESNPPSSGRHLGVQRNVDIGGGRIINLPPDPDVYPADIEIPRDAIPHILEHAGVFVGYHCDDGDSACEDVVQQLADVVNERLDENGDRVVMARDTDLPVGEIGLAAWTRVLNLRYEDYDEDAIVEFIATHSCRFDPEGFC